MSETIPPDANNAAAVPSVPLPKKHSKRSKYDKSKLPTPPPDPNDSKDGKEKDVFDYLESIIPNYSRSTSTFAPVIATEEAFDHLEKLYKLMEQMLDLREQNARLHRRIRDLEHLNNLENMQKQLELADVTIRDCPELDRDTAFAETILESILADSSKKDQKQKVSTPTMRPSILRRQRNRSGSATDKQVTLDANTIVQQEDGCENREKGAKVSKWTKVKAAFRWEKASNSVVDSKSQDSGIHVPVNLEIARYLRVPSTSDDTGHSPADSGAAGISTPGSLSTASSNEDFHRSDRRTPYEEFKSSEDEHSHHNYIPHNKDEQGSTKSSSKFHRTPWAKMKDMIHTRNSFKKKHRLSAASDDIQIDVELCSDNEEVFDDEKNKSNQVSSNPSPSGPPSYLRCHSNDVPLDVIERYQRAVAENDSNGSRWNNVKKAFLSRDKSSRSCPSSPKDNNDDEDEIQRNYRKLQKKLSLEFQEKLSEWERLKQNSPGSTNATTSTGLVEENRDPNFVKKMEEWQKIKSQQSTTKCQMPSEFDLPPEFKKKLQEWEKIKKSSGKEFTTRKKKLGEVPRWKSLSGHRSETSTAFEYPPLSEDFRKKLQEWKQIKSSGGALPSTEFTQKKPKEKTPSPRLSRKNSSPKQNKKQKDHDKELHWFEKELSKIEKEKQRLEKERQKFLEREERLSKLRRSVIGGGKKEVLIHTPSGFYRFEGISRKFTQKLYEWEKSQGIAPEASTFALLASPTVCTQETNSLARRHSASNTPPLARSKSADSIAISALNLTCPLMTHQPSSLSLNDVEELEKACLADSKGSSMQYLSESEETLDFDEPEAVLVEVEDYEEETAAPLQTFVEKHQLPIYQREEIKTMCEGETIAAPKIRRSESARAQTNYNLIEDIVNILRHLAENEIQVKNVSQLSNKGSHISGNATHLKEVYYNQKQLSSILLEKLLRLQDANSSVTSTITKEEVQSQSQMADMLEAVTDLSSEILQMAEKMDQNFKNRSIDNFNTTYNIYIAIIENIREIRAKILELRRHLSYVCAASDLTAPKRKLSKKKKMIIHKTVSNESKSSRCDTSDNSRRGSHVEEKRYIKAENTTSSNSQGAVKKRIKYRQKIMQNRSIPDSDDDEEEEIKDQRRNCRQHKKLTRARTISESNVDEKQISDLNLEKKLIVPTEINYMNVNVQDETKLPPDSPLTLFVKTTRKLFTPIGEANLTNVLTTDSGGKCSPNVESPRIFIETPPVITEQEDRYPEKAKEKFSSRRSSEDNVVCLPPIPNSPVPQRKIFKDISPGIKLMMAKYNQKISEQDSHGPKSGNSSGSNTPVAWRSPTSERRVKVQMEKYQEELKKMSPLLGGRGEVKKSASVGYLHSGTKQVTVPIRRDSIQETIIPECNNPILKSSSTGKIREKSIEETENSTEQVRKRLTLDISPHNDDRFSRHSPEIRLKKLQKAKEEFFRSTPSTAPALLTNEEVLKFPTRNRLSQISVDSESSYDNVLPGALIKSASAGMINIDPDTYKQIDPELHGGGYVSLPRNTKNPKGIKFGFSSIASKFRKVKMRKGKERDREKDKMNTVSTLCRQSLVVDINQIGTPDGGRNDISGLPPMPTTAQNGNNINNNNNNHSSRSGNESPTPSTSTSKSNISWIKKSLFKK